MRHDMSCDMCAVNQEKFGVTSDYQEETYTTKLDVSKLSAEQQNKAAKLARDIEDEQRRQSGVSCAVFSFGQGMSKMMWRR